MREIHRIVCCCSSGIGSSLMVEINLQKALAELQITGVTTGHSSLAALKAGEESADLIITGSDLAPLMREYPRVIVLKKIMSVAELTEKLEKAFSEEADTFFIE